MGSHCSIELNGFMVKHRDAFAPPEHGRDTSLRVEKPKHDRGSESAAPGGWWVRVDLDMWAASAHMVWY